jgi:hypothetical protein
VDATQLPLSDTETVLIGLAVCAVVVIPATWQLTGHFHVMAHEGMHGTVGSLAGRKIGGIELKGDATGGTVVAPSTGAGFLIAGFFGYLGSSLFGLGAARLIQFGHIVVVLWLIMGLLGLLLIKLTWSFGFITVPLAGFLIFLVLKHTSQSAQIVTVYVITWFLLLSGVRGLVEDGLQASDAGILSGRTSIPRIVWFALWLAGTGAAVVIGARWMLHPAVHVPVVTARGLPP